MNRERRLLRATGVVQGVGFRPFVHRTANELGITGAVGNDGAGVVIDATGPAQALDELQRRLVDTPPPLARVDAVVVTTREPADGGDLDPATFRILDTPTLAPGAATSTWLPPDIAVCDDCLREISDPTDRRYRYPFVNCTSCGPRFTITRRLPYDRPNTTMAAFPMCPQCEAEYHDPADRRFHAQPIACPVCGPHLLLTDAHGRRLGERDDALVQAQHLLDEGAIVAVKSLGGYHLMCDATNAAAVQGLRGRKRRGGKPFAVLVRSLDVLARAARTTAYEEQVLTSPERPIVLLRRGVDAPPWVEWTAPRVREVGAMLPCTPLQYLLFDGLRTSVLVCTSGNLADEPIAIGDGEAQERLIGIADHFLANDREVHTACDDSVVRVHGRTVLPVRRARGFTPLPIPVAVPPHLRAHDADRREVVLAMGGDLKGALCLLADGRAVLSQHLGDHGQLATYRAAREAALSLTDLVGATPTTVAIDLHPAYLSGRLGRELAAGWGAQVVPVQHHHAHVCSVAAEHRVEGDVLGIACDGTGYGGDGTMWGGELLHADLYGYRRKAHLSPVALPGGDSAAEHPARSALAHLWAAGVPWHDALPCVRAVPADERRVLGEQLRRGVLLTPSSSIGRLFDAVASLAGVRHEVEFEAQAAIELEAIADASLDRPSVDPAHLDRIQPYRFPLPGPTGAVDPGPVIRAVAADVLAGVPPATIATRFHLGLPLAFLSWLDERPRTPRHHTNRGEELDPRATVVLSGGVFQNRLLTAWCQLLLERAGYTVLRHRLVPTNDGGLALGQAMVALASRGG